MENNCIDQASDILYDSRIYLKKIKELPIKCSPQTINEAYKIQDSLVKKYLSSKNFLDKRYMGMIVIMEIAKPSTRIILT